MIDDQDMNILAIFCLNALSENEESHSYIRSSGTSFSIHCLDQKKEFKEDEVEQKNQKNIDSGNNGQSLFNRINFLLEYHV